MSKTSVVAKTKTPENEDLRPKTRKRRPENEDPKTKTRKRRPENEDPLIFFIFALQFVIFPTSNLPRTSITQQRTLWRLPFVKYPLSKF